MSNSSGLFISLIFHSEACAPDAAPVSLLCLKSKYWAGITWGEEERVAVASLSAFLSASLSAFLPASLPVPLSASLWASLWASLPASLWASLPASLQKLPAPLGRASSSWGMAAVNKCGVFPPDEHGKGGGKGLREKCWSANETCVRQGFSAAALQLCCQLRTNSQHGH